MHKSIRRIALFCFALSAALAHLAQAQTFSVLHNFTNGADGAHPLAGITVGPGGVLYGTAGSGGTYGDGTVFKLDQVNSSWVFSNLYEFTGGSDGAYPLGGVVFGPYGALFGTTQQGGQQNNGTVFALTPPATFCRSLTCSWDEAVLHTFTGAPDGFNPGVENLVFDAAGNIYGTTTNGGPHVVGTVFELSPSNGGGYTETILHDFAGPPDGAYPEAGLVFDAGGNLYGTTGNGGTGHGCGYGCGTAFQLTPSGGSWQENVLVSFDLGSAGLDGGYYPYSPLILDSADNLYGTTIYSREFLNGVVFKLTPSDGSFTPSAFYAFPSGCQPYGGVTMDAAGNFFGVCLNASFVFELTNCSQQCTMIDLHDFDGRDGDVPYGTPTLDANGNLYGTTEYGGTSFNCEFGCGVVWEITGVGAPQKK